MTGRRRRLGQVVLAVTAVALVTAGLAGSATGAAKAPGTVTPPKGSGINTPAALNDPRCVTTNSAYGRWSFVSVGTGPVCVRPFEDGEKNGGATVRGVTAKTITIVAVTQNPAQTATQKQQGGTPPKNNNTGETGTMEDALHDLFAAYGHVYETWGRTIELKFVQSSGDDEAAQRADALRVEDHKPFAVLETTPTGLDVLTTKVAQDGYLVMSNTTTTDKAIKQQPYRWGQADQVAVAVNAGEFVGKQLVGKKAEYAGSAELQKANRVIGVVYPPAVFDLQKWFVPEVEKQGGKISGPSYVGLPNRWRGTRPTSRGTGSAEQPVAPEPRQQAVTPLLVGVPVVGEQAGREEPLGQVVVTAVAMASHKPQDTRLRQSLQQRPHRVRRPPVPRDRRSGFEVDRAERPLGGDPAEQAVDERGVLDEDAVAVTLMGAVPGQAEPRQLVRRQERKALVVRLEQPAFFVEEGICHVASVAGDSGEHDKVVVPACDVDRVELDGSEPLDDGHDAIGPGGSARGGASTCRLTRNRRAALRPMGRGITIRDGSDGR